MADELKLMNDAADYLNHGWEARLDGRALNSGELSDLLGYLGRITFHKSHEEKVKDAKFYADHYAKQLAELVNVR